MTKAISPHEPITRQNTIRVKPTAINMRSKAKLIGRIIVNIRNNSTNSQKDGKFDEEQLLV
jgi:hypothetical protein